MQVLLSEPSVAYGRNTSTLHGVTDPMSNQVSSSTVLNNSVHFAEPIAEMFKKLNRLENLAPNWDSYGAEGPSRRAISQARSFLMRNHKLALPFYFIAPGVNGEVMVELQQGSKAAELYFLPEGEGELVLFENDEAIAEGSLDALFRQLIDHFNS